MNKPLISVVVVLAMLFGMAPPAEAQKKWIGTILAVAGAAGIAYGFSQCKVTGELGGPQHYDSFTDVPINARCANRKLDFDVRTDGWNGYSNTEYSAASRYRSEFPTLYENRYSGTASAGPEYPLIYLGIGILTAGGLVALSSRTNTLILRPEPGGLRLSRSFGW